MNEDFINGVVVDLREYCADLLHPGALPSGSPSALGLASSPSDLGELAFARMVVSEVRRVLGDQWEVAEADGVPDRTPVPVRAVAPRSAAGWAITDVGPVPRYWLRAPLTVRVGSRHLEWLHRLVGVAAEKSERSLSRLVDSIADARDNIASDSGFARDGLEALERVLRDARSTRDSVLRLRREITLRRAASRGLVRGSAVPSLNPTWSRLRGLARISDRGSGALGSRIERLLTPPVPIAELPFLYQRWVGLQLVRSLERHGFRAVGDPRSALFLGGHVRLIRDDVWLEMWVESRLSRGRQHPSGLATDLGEVSPDYVLAMPGDQGRDFYILDATLSGTDERLRKKCEYRKRCHVDVPRVAAGWTIRRRPMRAWAVAPLRKQVELMIEDGSGGALGLRPGHGDFENLDAWTADAIRHAVAWARNSKVDSQQDVAE